LFLNPRIKIPRILLIEDNLGDAQLIIEGIKENGREIHLDIFADGAEAMDFLHKKNSYPNAKLPNIILLDLNLPKKNGEILLKEIKSDPKLRHIPIIILTVSQAEEDILQCYTLYANCYIIKPFEITNLMIYLNQLIHFWFDIATLPKNKDMANE